MKKKKIKTVTIPYSYNFFIFKKILLTFEKFKEKINKCFQKKQINKKVQIRKKFFKKKVKKNEYLKGSLKGCVQTTRNLKIKKKKYKI